MRNLLSRDTPYSRYKVGVLSKALDILDLLRNTAGGATLTAISAALKLPKPTVFRIVSTLESRAYVERSADARYRLTSSRRNPYSHRPGTLIHMARIPYSRSFSSLVVPCGHARLSVRCVVHSFYPWVVSRFPVGPLPGYRGHTGRKMPSPSSAMSSGRLLLDQVARQHCLSPLR
jgi:hypothetical protein